MPGTSNYAQAAAGLASQLKTQLGAGWQSYSYPPDSVNSLPVAIVMPADPLDYEIAFQGNTFEATFRVVCLVASVDDGNGFQSLYDVLDPTATAPGGFRRALLADKTLGGKVDDAKLTHAENIGRRELWGGFYFGADFLVQVIKTVA